MGNEKSVAFAPDYALAPGESILDVLGTLGMSQADLAARTGRSVKMINEIVKGKAAITPETALQLERVLGMPASFWSNRERQYREALAKSDEGKDLGGWNAWIQNFPLADMCKWGWIKRCVDQVSQTREILNFLGVAAPEQWDSLQGKLKASFRKSKAFKADPVAIAVWLRKGELDARKVACSEFNADAFLGVLQECRGLTVKSPDVFLPRVVGMCAKAGVAVVLVRELPGTRCFGATQWLAPNRALIQLSLRYKSDDHLWFTFYHESGHILLHPKKQRFFESGKADNAMEKEADRFASDLLIPPKKYSQFVSRGNFGSVAIRTFAQELGIAPGIVVGRLQHEEEIPYSHCNELKVRFAWANPPAN